LLLCGGWAAQVSPSPFFATKPRTMQPALVIRHFRGHGFGQSVQLNYGSAMNSRCSDTAFSQGRAVNLDETRSSMAGF